MILWESFFDELYKIAAAGYPIPAMDARTPGGVPAAARPDTSYTPMPNPPKVMPKATNVKYQSVPKPPAPVLPSSSKIAQYGYEQPDLSSLMAEQERYMADMQKEQEEQMKKLQRQQRIAKAKQIGKAVGKLGLSVGDMLTREVPINYSFAPAPGVTL